MKDYIVRATAANAQIRAFAASTTELVEEARTRHNTSPVATAALGRLLTAGAMMGSMMKNPADVLTLQVQCGGPIERICTQPGCDASAEERKTGCRRCAWTRIFKCDQGYGTQRTIFRTDDFADRRDRRRSDLLFCNL